MKLSKKSRYGIAALIDLAIYQKEGRVALNNIAERNKISLQYLEQVFAALRRNKIVKSIKGAQGGYLLAKDVKDITVAEIIDALDGTYKIENEEGESVASRIIQDKIVDRVNDNLDEILTNITLRDLLEAHEEYIEYNQNMYYIKKKKKTLLTVICICKTQYGWFLSCFKIKNKKSYKFLLTIYELNGSIHTNDKTCKPSRNYMIKTGGKRDAYN